MLIVCRYVLNCLLVVLITVLIDAEIEMLPQARAGNESELRVDKTLSWRPYGDGTDLKASSVYPPTRHHMG